MDGAQDDQLTPDEIERIIVHLLGDACEEAGYQFWLNPCPEKTSPIEFAIKRDQFRPTAYVLAYELNTANGGVLKIAKDDPNQARRSYRKFLLADPNIKGQIATALIELQAFG